MQEQETLIGFVGVFLEGLPKLSSSRRSGDDAMDTAAKERKVSCVHGEASSVDSDDS